MSALPDDDMLLAAELALGLIDGAERDTALARVASDADFAAAYQQWQAYAAALFDGRGEVPRPSVWSAIVARLPANDTGGISRATLRRWQAGAAAASVAALVLAVVALERPAPVAVRAPVVAVASAPMVAVLTGKTGVVTVSYDPATGRMTSAATGLALGDRAPELWVIPADGKPRSMGVIRAAAPGWGKVPAAAAAVLASGVTLAVSEEPAGGSPTGLPTGPVILTGRMAAAS